MLNAWVDQGYLSAEEAHSHPQRHVITKAVTGNEISAPDSQEISFTPQDRIIVATDGLWDNFHVEEVIEMLQGLSPQTGVSHLLQKATTKMKKKSLGHWEGPLVPKPDNISILIGDFKASE